jgi:hypothetical protein
MTLLSNESPAEARLNLLIPKDDQITRSGITTCISYYNTSVNRLTRQLELDRDASVSILKIRQGTLQVPHLVQFTTEVGHTIEQMGKKLTPAIGEGRVCERAR